MCFYILLAPPPQFGLNLAYYERQRGRWLLEEVGG